jgi:hypothetical protein
MSTDIEIRDELSQVPANLFGTSDPVAVVEQSSKIASALADVIRSKQLSKRIGQKDHVLVEGWCLLGSMLGVFPVVEWTRPVEGGWEARVEARTLNGQVVGAAEAECLRSENTWKTRDDYALRSMAQTRAVSKALRGPLGFIVQLAGYNATPAEEMVPLSGAGDESPLPGSTTPAPESDPVVGFGKHKGKRVSEIPATYRQWLVENFQAQSEQDIVVMAAVKDSLIPF